MKIQTTNNTNKLLNVIEKHFPGTKWIKANAEEWYGEQGICEYCGHLTIDMDNYCPHCGRCMINADSN